MMSKIKESQIQALEAKIKQDKLDQRRTVLSKVDAGFVTAVGALADAAGVELEGSVAALVEANEPAEEEAKTVSRPAKNAKKEVLIDFMDEHEIAYESDDNKADLNEKIDEWAESR